MNYAFTMGGRPMNGGLAQHSPAYISGGIRISYGGDALSPYTYNFNSVFPGHKILCVVVLSRRTQTGSSATSVGLTFQDWVSPKPTIDWIPLDTIEATYPGASSDVRDLERVGWFIMDYPFSDFVIPSYSKYQLFKDPNPDPVGALFSYYAIPPGMEDVIIGSRSQYPSIMAPCVYTPTNLTLDGSPLYCPIWTGVQRGTFNPLAILH